MTKKKKRKITELYNIGKELTMFYLHKIWNMETGKYASTDLYKLSESKITARFKQLCCKKALDIKRSITEKIDTRKYTIDKIKNEIKVETNQKNIEKKIKTISNLEKTIEKLNKMPEIKRFSLDLNGNIISIELDSTITKKYKNWIRLNSLGKNYNMYIPFIKTKPFNKWNNIGNLSQFISINNDQIKVVFKFKVEKKTKGKKVGCDIGLNKVFSFNNGHQSNPNELRREQPKIHKYICKKVHGSNNCRKARNERDLYINYSINRMNLKGIKILYLEDIKYLRFGKRCSRFLKCWRYRHIFNRIEARCEENGIEVVKVNPCNTSRRCFECKWVFKENRNKEECKIFNCTKCNHCDDSDVNGAKNIKYSGIHRIEFIGDSKIGFYSN